MYRWLVRMRVRRVMARSRAGDMAPTLALWAEDGHFVFPGRSSWAADLHDQAARGAWYGRFARVGLQIEPEEVLVSGPPWRTHVCIRFTDHATGPDGEPVYENTGVLFATMSWGKIRFGTVYEDTQKVADFDDYLARHEGELAAAVAARRTT
jgi:ketosteroid isomerase-like protein